MRRLSSIALLGLVLLSACSGSKLTQSAGSDSTSSSSSSSGGSSSSSSSGGTTTVVAAALTAITSATSIPSDGSATATITVLALNSKHELLSGVDVAFSATSGGIAVVQGTTDSSGAATATLSTAGVSTVRNITVTATAGSLTATVQVAVVGGSSATTNVVSSITLSSSAANILSDGSTTATITALARDAANNVLAGVPITFGAGSGALQANAATTGAAGTVTATLSTGGDPSLRNILVTGTTAKLSSTVQVGVITPSTPTIPVYTMGNGTGSTFVANQIGGLNPTVPPIASLSAGGSQGLQITIVDQTSTLYDGGPVTVTFNSPCIANGSAKITASAGSTTPVTNITTTTGTVNATYVAMGCSTPAPGDVIQATASVTPGGGTAQTVSATGDIVVLPASVGSIQFVSATPTTIGLKGTGLNETSTLIFKVVNSTGGAPTIPVLVNFALNTSVGGINIAPLSATTLPDGTVQTVVSSGVVHTAVRVTASIAAGGTVPEALSTQSSELTVTTGLPTSASFSSAIGAPTYPPGYAQKNLACPNSETWNTDGITVPVTVYLSDRYGNPVPDGTPVAFTTYGGQVVGSCLTGAPSVSGQCTVTWTSTNPRPGSILNVSPPIASPATPGDDGYPSSYANFLAAGRAVILATTIGEESFTDAYGRGGYLPGDPFADLGEPYRDDDEHGSYQFGDFFLNFFNTAPTTGARGLYTGPSGSFIGITCNGTSPTSMCSEGALNSLAIGASSLIIMSTSLGSIEFDLTDSTTGITNSGTAKVPVLALSMGATKIATLAFKVYDTNGNSMAAGTGVAFSAVAPTTTGTVTASGGTAVGCNSTTDGDTFTASFVPLATGQGTFSVTATSPSGSITSLTIPITVNP